MKEKMLGIGQFLFWCVVFVSIVVFILNTFNLIVGTEVNTIDEFVVSLGCAFSILLLTCKLMPHAIDKLLEPWVKHKEK